MRLQSRGSSWSKAKGYVSDFGDRFIPKRQDRPNFFTRRNISQKRMAELNERIRAEKAATQQRPVTRSHGPVTVQERTQPGTQRSSRTFRGGSGAPYMINIHEHFMGGPRGKYRRKWPRKFSEVYRPTGMLTV